jgi:hypothetical protein
MMGPVTDAAMLAVPVRPTTKMRRRKLARHIAEMRRSEIRQDKLGRKINLFDRHDQFIYTSSNLVPLPIMNV